MPHYKQKNSNGNKGNNTKSILSSHAKKKKEKKSKKTNNNVSNSTTKSKLASSSSTTKSNNTSQDATTANRPRNHLIKDATSPYTFSFSQFGETRRVTIGQTAAEETWPGGALWDIGLLLAKVLVMVNIPQPQQPTPPPSSSSYSKKIDIRTVVSRLKAPGIWPKSWKNSTILELGCGVGLTGLVGALLGSKLTVLTDLRVVIEKVTRPNLEMNTSSFRLGQKVIAMPLCWGNKEDEDTCAKVFTEASTRIMSVQNKSLYKNTAAVRKRNIKKSSRSNDSSSEVPIEISSAMSKVRDIIATPDIILIGDVAYQHKPGLPSHFNALLSTLLKFGTSRETVLIFGTRMRMPASADLLIMIREYFEEVIEPPIEAQEIDDEFHCDNLGKKSMITIHIFKRKVMEVVQK